MNCKKCGHYAHGGTDGADLCDDCARVETNAELTRLRAIVARVEDVEGMAKVLARQPSSFDPHFTLATAVLKWEKHDSDARAVRDYVMGEG